MINRSKIKYAEGDVFLIDSDAKQPIVGLIIRRRGRTKVLAGYFWKYDGTNLNSLKLTPDKAIKYCQFSGLGFEIGDWKVLGPYVDWHRSNWSVPSVRRHDDLRKCYYKIDHNDDLIGIGNQRISDKEAELLFDDGLYGYVILENVLRKMLRKDMS